MKRKNNECGVLAVEASIVLFFLIFFMLFIWNFAGVFSAQNAVSHASMQATQTIAVDNLSKSLADSKNSTTVQMVGEVTEFINPILKFLGFDMIDEFKTFDQNAARNQVYEDLFYYFIGGENGEEVAKQMGIDTKTIKFEIDENVLSAGTLRVKITYDVKLKFGVFGLDKMTFVKYASCKLFGMD